MNTKLLVAGIALTLLAFRSEKMSAGAEAASTQPATTRVWSGVGHAFNAVLADAVRMGVSNSEQALKQYAPALKETSGAEGHRARQLAAKIRQANERAKQQLVLGHTTIALDFAIQASTHEDELKKILFERR